MTGKVDFPKIKNSIEESLQLYECLKPIVNEASEVFWILDANNPDKIMYISPALTKLWGYDPKKIRESPQEWFDAVYLEDKDRLVQSIMQLKQNNIPYDITYRIKTKNGKTAWIRSITKIVQSSDKTKRIMGIANDVTELKQKEQEIAQLKAKLKR